MLEEVFNETSSQLSKVSQDQELLKNLILQGLYQLMDDQVNIIARKNDKDLVKTAIQAATKIFKESVNRDIKVELDKENNLPDDR